MANFVLIGNRIINLDLVAAAERDGNGGKVTVYLAAGEGQPMKWVFDKL